MNSGIMPKLSGLRRSRLALLRAGRYSSLLVFVIGFAVLGSVLLVVSRAATNPVSPSVEAESGTLAGGANAVADSSASGGQAVRFGSSSSYSCARTYVAALPADWSDSPTANSPGGACTYSDISSHVFGASLLHSSWAGIVGQNVWGAVPTAFTQTLHANSIADWYVTVNKPSDGPSDPQANGTVSNYPNLGFWMDGKVDDYSSITSSWNVTIPHTTSVAGWAAYDLWFNDDNTEVMIQADIGANSYFNCTTVATATFGGDPWHMCDFGDERIWKHGTDDNHLINQASGTVDIKQILTWMESHTFVDPDTGATRQQLAPGSKWQTSYNGVSFGFEVPSTSGQNADFRVNDFSWAAVK